MKYIVGVCIITLLILCVCTSCAQSSSGRLHTVDPSGISMTWRHITSAGSKTFRINESIRGEIPYGRQHAAELDFVYTGLPIREDALANGEMRRQIGLKFRAYNECNVVYVMWHIEPTYGIHVSVKSNPDKTTHKQCGAHGYIAISPQQFQPVSPIKIGEKHTLRASISGDILSVWADGSLVWTGKLPHQAFAFDGPVGIRSDNASFEVQMKVSQ